MSSTRLFSITLLLGGCLLAAGPAEAAESYDNCTNFIDSLPATISTQGVWCLRKNLSTGITSGKAITIAKNNVTIDCNDFKVGGLAAGNSSSTTGIIATGQQNLTVKNCGVRGFRIGIGVSGGAGHVIENNRLDYNLTTGISVASDVSNTVIRNNRVYDTGGSQSSSEITAIRVVGGDAIDVQDNIIAGVVGTPGLKRRVTGILRWNLSSTPGSASSRITGNSVSSLLATGGGRAVGFENKRSSGNTEENIIFRDNHLVMHEAQTDSIGVRCVYPGVSVRDNTVLGFETGLESACRNRGGNDVF